MDLIKLVVILVAVGLAAFLLGATGYGIYLAFSASIVLGIVALFVEPLPLIFGLVQLLADVNLAEKIVQLFH